MRRRLKGASFLLPIDAVQSVFPKGIQHGRDLFYELPVVGNSKNTTGELTEKLADGRAGERAEIARWLVQEQDVALIQYGFEQQKLGPLTAGKIADGMVHFVRCIFHTAQVNTRFRHAFLIPVRGQEFFWPHGIADALPVALGHVGASYILAGKKLPGDPVHEGALAAAVGTQDAYL